MLNFTAKNNSGSPIGHYCGNFWTVVDKGLGAVAEEAKADVIERGKGGELGSEVQSLQPVHTHLLDYPLLIATGRKQPERLFILVEGNPGMRPEGHYDTLLPALCGLGEKGVNDQTVPRMDTVEKTGCDYSHFTSGKS